MFKGIIPAFITPMKDQEIDYEATSKHIDKLIGDGVHGIFILGTNGEFHVLNDEEKVAFAKHVIEHTNNRVPIYVGVGHCGTKDTIDLAKRIAQYKPSAFTVITPYLVKVTQEELETHINDIADAVDVPLILYNIPTNTGINIEPETLGRLIKNPKIVGIKDSSGNMDNIAGYIEQAKSNVEFSVLVGSDSKILSGLQLGAKGAVASTANVITKHLVQLYDCFNKGDIKNAQQLQIDIDVIRMVLKKATIPAVLKRTVTLLGNDVGEARKPVASINDKYDDEILEMLKFYGLK